VRRRQRRSLSRADVGCPCCAQDGARARVGCDIIGLQPMFEAQRPINVLARSPAAISAFEAKAPSDAEFGSMSESGFALSSTPNGVASVEDLPTPDSEQHQQEISQMAVRLAKARTPDTRGANWPEVACVKGVTCGDVAGSSPP